MKLLRLMAVVLLSTLLSGCFSNPVKERAGHLDENIKKLATTLEAAKKSYQSVQQSKDWSFYQPYALREKWDDWLADATTSLASLREKYTTTLEPHIKKGNSKDEQLLLSMLTTLEAGLSPLKASIAKVADRMAFLVAAKANAEKQQKELVEHLPRIDVLVGLHAPALAKSKAEHATRIADIDTRYAVLTKLQSIAHEAMAKFSPEFLKHQGEGQADYAVMGDSAKVIAEARSKLEQESADFGTALQSLSQDYMRVLTDMRVDYRVSIGRSSWDNDSDWDTSPDVMYGPISVSRSTFEYLQKLPQGESDGQAGMIARVTRGWGTSVKPLIDTAVWDQLKLDVWQQWRSGDDEGTFWLNDFEPKFYHKYEDVSGSKKTTTDWVEVDEEDFLEHLTHIGMAIKSKAFGQFEDEAIEQAVPPGMAMVGNPKYGTWQTTSTGERQWGFFENYLFYHWLFGGSSGHYYSSHDYDSYKRWQNDPARTAGWYGRDANKPTYGSSGSYTQNSGLYRRAAFGKIGGTDSVPSTMRDAGARMRGRGPRGGK